MKNYDAVKESFGKQAALFASYHMSKAEYTDYLTRKVAAEGTEHALEVAAGTCICGRALAAYVKDIECLDLTSEMLAEGKRLAAESGIQNISFSEGNAETLPYVDESFDLVITRLSLHHFTDYRKVFDEMHRVLKSGGKLVIWDMVAAEKSLREKNDSIERLRDPSHVHILSQEEFEELFETDYNLITEELTLVPVNLQSWMELTETAETIQKNIVIMMQKELAGGERTGFHPYEKDGSIYFDHRWLLLIGIKK